MSETSLAHPLVAPVRAADRVRALPLAPAAVLRRLLLLNYVLLVADACRFLEDVHVRGPLATAFVLADLLLYPLAYVFVVGVPALLAAWLLGRQPVARACRRLQLPALPLLYGSTVVGLALLQLLIFCDVLLVRLYGFHMNGFVWNLLTVPGGIESMDSGSTSGWALAGLGLLMLLLQLLLLAGVRSSGRLGAWVEVLRVRRPRALAAGLFVLLAFERLTYGLSDAADYRPVTTLASVFPFHVPVRMHRFAERLGLEALHGEEREFDVPHGGRGLRYPLAPLTRAPGSRAFNIVWLVAESLRADMLDPGIMPETSAFAAGALDFRQHWSGGNGTRMGMFSMFYGLYGSYWFPFLAQNRSPALLDLLAAEGWELHARTSAQFTFPEFDETIFRNVPPGHLHGGQPQLRGWENDRLHVSALLDEIDRRDPARPFFQFLFFESPHARYFFPPESVIRPDCLEDMDYATMDLEHDIGRIKNRYVNACHHLDSQVGRIVDHLRQGGLLQDTIVLLTGDHGEEFMEHGRWGHHSDWSDEQARTPLVLWIPGVAARRIDTLSSHLDIVPTLAARLGVSTRAADFCLGRDLLGEGARSDCVVAGWSDLALVNAHWRAAFPTDRSASLALQLFTPELVPVEDDAAFWAECQPRVLQMMEELARFQR